MIKGETEEPYTGEYCHFNEDGIYLCAGCGNQLFSSEDKFDPGSGWPSFHQTIDPGRIEQKDEKTDEDSKIEVVCANCHGHLGHLFGEGASPEDRRYCINSAALKFQPV